MINTSSTQYLHCATVLIIQKTSPFRLNQFIFSFITTHIQVFIQVVQVEFIQQLVYGSFWLRADDAYLVGKYALCKILVSDSLLGKDSFQLLYIYICFVYLEAL